MASPAVDNLKVKRPEWAPWLRLVEEALRESANTAWDAVVPERVEFSPAVPALSGTTALVPGRLLRKLLERLASAAARGGTSKMATVANLPGSDLDVVSLFQASVTQDAGRANEIASRAGIDSEALQAVVALLGVPFLHACRRQWLGRGGTSWTEGFCGICGAWPAFAEVRGVERSRYHRCGRCGSEWHARILHCPYCRTTNHDDLAALVPEKDAAKGVVDACRACRGYVKVFTRLQGCAPAAVMLEDLASVELDVAALHAGYARPAGAGCAPAVSVRVSGGRGFPAWAS